MSLRTLRRVLAGEDGPGRSALPAGEFLHPVPLMALAVLVINDHYLKGGGLISAQVTGKLSDIAGLLFFPLLCTAAWDLILLAVFRAGAAIDFSLNRWKLRASCIVTGAMFAATKLSQSVADWCAGVLGAMGIPSTIIADPTDLVALASLAVAYGLGRRHIRRVPLGRIAVLERQWQRRSRPAAEGLADVIGAGAANETVAAAADSLQAYFDGGPAEPAIAALDKLRDS